MVCPQSTSSIYFSALLLRMDSLGLVEFVVSNAIVLKIYRWRLSRPSDACGDH